MRVEHPSVSSPQRKYVNYPLSDKLSERITEVTVRSANGGKAATFLTT